MQEFSLRRRQAKAGVSPPATVLPLVAVDDAIAGMSKRNAEVVIAAVSAVMSDTCGADAAHVSVDAMALLVV